MIADALQARLLEMSVPNTMFSLSVALIPPTRPDTDPQTILVHYTSLYPSNMYIADTVKVEFGVRALKEPFADVSIVSEIGRHIQVTSYIEQPFTVRAVVPVKTLIEKLLLLHEKFTGGEPDQIKIAERQSSAAVAKFREIDCCSGSYLTSSTVPFQFTGLPWASEPISSQT
jgi:Nucleotidyl transferase AbiEii toxin, Type IV TA system